MNYKLQLTKPINIRGSHHGSIDALINIFNWAINEPVNKVNADTVRAKLEKELRLLNCSYLSVSSESLTRNFNKAFGSFKNG